jgi:tRNA (cytidine32/uridine32-2'-O)-methyltransferase
MAIRDASSFTNILDRIKVVLVNTSHPGNIGATARAMANMGLSKLALVQPLDYPSMQATARAAGADDVLDEAQLYPTLANAVENCSHVYGTTARLRSITWPEYSPQELAENIKTIEGNQDIAIVFGRERAGLTNEELDLCQALVHIPVDERHTSLNLASAVMVLAFSLRSVLVDKRDEPRLEGHKHASPIANSEQMQFYFNSLDTLLHRIEFYKGNASRVMRKLRRLYYKAEPSQEDIRILLGTISALNSELDKK